MPKIISVPSLLTIPILKPKLSLEIGLISFSSNDFFNSSFSIKLPVNWSKYLSLVIVNSKGVSYNSAHFISAYASNKGSAFRKAYACKFKYSLKSAFVEQFAALSNKSATSKNSFWKKST